jgi:hypothetical protein
MNDRPYWTLFSQMSRVTLMAAGADMLSPMSKGEHSSPEEMAMSLALLAETAMAIAYELRLQSEEERLQSATGQ